MGDEGASETRLEDADEAVKAEVEVKEEEQAINAAEDGPKGDGSGQAEEDKPNVEADPAPNGVDGSAKPKRGRPKGNGKAKQ